VGEYDQRWERRFKASIRHLALKERALEHKGGACQICGYSRCPAALHFHFADSNDRAVYISAVSSWEQIQPALDRSTLLCANCRCEVRAGWHPAHLVLEDERL
jgi:hypothetical protein